MEWRQQESFSMIGRRLFLACSVLPAVLGSLTMPSAGQSSDQEALLVRAASTGDLALVKELLQSGVAIDARDGDGRTPLLAAVDGNHHSIAIHLIASGADINAQARNLDSPWLLAGARGRTAILKAMLATGKVDYSKRNRYGGNALIPACERGFVETVALLLAESRIDVNHVNDLGWTALLEAIVLGDGSRKYEEIVRLLIAHRANVNFADKNGETPLKHAQSRGFRVIAQMLRDAGGR
jgi:hypothetical protein